MPDTLARFVWLRSSMAVLLVVVISCKSGNAPPPQGVTTAADGDRFRADLGFVAAPRPSGSPHWQATQDRCAQGLAAAGMTVRRQQYAGGVNVVGRREGSNASGEIVLVAAHYDSVANCPGADDNASGVAAVLEVARILGGRGHPRTLVCACWDEEESGYRGSAAFVRDWDPAARLVAHYNLEMIAFASTAPNSQIVPPGFAQLFPAPIAAVEANQRRGDFIALVTDSASSDAAASFVAHAVGLKLPVQRLDVPDALTTSRLISDLRRSDHSSFWDRALPGIMLTDTANFRNANYHCQGGNDSVSTLDVGFALKVVQATASAAAELLGD